MLKKFWFKFDISAFDNYPLGVSLGCGVTAFDYEDALMLLRGKVFKRGSLPPIQNVQEDIDISTLDANHILPNMNVPNRRGVWFPQGYD